MTLSSPAGQLPQRIVPPPGYPHVLQRARLSRRLAELPQRRLTALVAGAGFGKTTLLAGWAAEHHCAWYTLAAEDRDPLALARGIVAALRLRVPDLPHELADTLGGIRGPGGTGELDAFVPALAAALHERLRSDLVLVIDDAHVVDEAESGASTRLLADLCHMAPDRLHLALATRAELAFPVERLLLHGQARIITAEALRFDPAEAADLLVAVAGPAAATHSQQVSTLTGGWPVAVRLVAEALIDIAPDDRAGVLGALTAPGGVGDLIDDLLAREFMPRASPAALHLLRKASALDTFDAALLTDLGVPDAAEVLGTARRRGVLVVPAAGDPHRATLTELARRHVVRRLGVTEEELATVRRAAAVSHAARGEIAEAVRYRVQLGDAEALAELLSLHGAHLLAAGHVALVLSAAGQVTGDARTAAIDLLEGEAHQIRGDWDRAMACLRRLAPEGGPVPVAAAWRLGLIHHMRGELPAALDLYRRGLSDPDGGALRDQALTAAWASGAAWICGDVDQCRGLAELAATLAARSGDHTASAAAHTAQAMLAALDGDRRANDMHYLRALDHAQLAGDVLHLIRIRSNRGSRFLEEGHYREACAELDTAVRLAELADFPTFRTIALVNRAEARRRLGQLEEAARDLYTALAEQQRLGSRLASYPLVALGDINLDQGNTAQAQSCFTEALDLAEQAGDLQALVPALAGLALAVAAYDPAAALGLAQRAIDVGPALGRTRALLALAHIATAQRDYERAAVVASEAAEAARNRRDRAALAETLELQAKLALNPAGRQALLEEAEALWTALDCPLGLWRSRIALAKTCDRVTAEGILAAAVTHCRRIGARTMANVAAAALAELADAPAPALGVQTLGGFRVSRHAELVPYGEWRSRKARDLLKVLIARRGMPLSRDVLLDLLWTDETAEAAAARLSVTMSTLRAILDPAKEFPPDHYVASADGGVWLRVAHVEIDVETFLLEAKRALAKRPTGNEATEELTAVEARYTGDFCPEDLTSEYLMTVREEARAVYLAVVRALASAYSAGGDHETAVRYLLRLLAQDPYDEPAHLALVRALDQAGRYGEARRMYRGYTARMRELEIEPAAYPSVS